MLPENSSSIQMAGIRPNLPAITRLRAWMGKHVTSAKQAAAFPAPPRIDDPSSTWYAGMIIDPTDFSQQLCELQISLQHAGRPLGRQVPVAKS